jgi:hypothetical protein
MAERGGFSRHEMDLFLGAGWSEHFTETAKI